MAAAGPGQSTALRLRSTRTPSAKLRTDSSLSNGLELHHEAVPGHRGRQLEFRRPPQGVHPGDCRHRSVRHRRAAGGGGGQRLGGRFRPRPRPRRTGNHTGARSQPPQSRFRDGVQPGCAGGAQRLRPVPESGCLRRVERAEGTHRVDGAGRTVDRGYLRHSPSRRGRRPPAQLLPLPQHHDDARHDSGTRPDAETPVPGDVDAGVASRRDTGCGPR
jgi:hypothetical protein